MTPERYKRVGEVYSAAAAVDAERRAAFLAEACGDDEALRQEVESLLGFGDQQAFIDRPAMEAAARALASDSTTDFFNRRIGHYRVLSLLGRGGMGEVYLALDERLNRKVAIKLLSAGFTEDADRVRRFEQEARAASALNHPNILTIYEITEALTEALTEVGAPRCIVAEYVEGETLRQRMADAPGHRLLIAEALEIAAQVAAALSAAHEAGIAHRDIKPENVMVRPDGYVKVLDFGLAKLTEAPAAISQAPIEQKRAQSTETGMVMGTPRYMSPEQARGERVDGRTDIFSLGVMLYEMGAGSAPFAGATHNEVIAAILRDEPPPLSFHVPGAPGAPRELERIIGRALQKDRAARYQSAKDLLNELKRLQQQLGARTALPTGSTLAEGPGGAGPARDGQSAAQATSTAQVLIGEIKRYRRFVTVTLAALVVAAGVFFYWRNANVKWARAQVPRVEELIQQERFFEAYDLSAAVREYVPDEPTIARLMRTMTDDFTFLTDPPGALVYLKRFAPNDRGEFPSRQFMGVTPIEHLQVARGGYFLQIEKEGYAKIERAISGQPPRSGLLAPPFRFEDKLIAAGKVPDGMTLVPGGDYRLSGWRRPTEDRVRLDDFLIDKFEVSNREYKEFITAGGYLKQQFWKFPFVKDGKPISWEGAMREFKDRTGLPAPRNWSNQEFPAGQAEQPVTGVTWHEAAAYAAFRGKQLPTIFQWEKAARGGKPLIGAGQLMPWGFLAGTAERRANFAGQGTLPVASMEFGTSHYGCYNMAGNVSEWCFNERAEGFVTAGGSWADPVYLFGNYGAYPGFYSSDKLGFRCVTNLPGPKGDGGAMAIKTEAVAPSYTPMSAAGFTELTDLYRYERTPLDARVVEVVEADAWRREKITFAGADGERAIGYLYLPKNFAPPWQVIHFAPPGSVSGRSETLPHALEAEAGPLVKSGRAAFAVVLKGYIERDWPPAYVAPSYDTAEYRDQVINWVTDLRRGLDYLETRNDIDAGRIAYFASSVTGYKLILPAVENRYRALILTGAGLRKVSQNDIREANPINFVPFIGGAKLMLQGRYDETSQLELEAKPLFKLLRDPKRLIIYDSGHVTPIEILTPAANAWLDERLGPVKRP